MTRDDLLRRLLVWAETQYPAQAKLPPAQRRQSPPWREFKLSREEMVALFAGTTTMQAHLALVDEPYIHARLRDPVILTAAYRSWTSKGGYARPLGQMLAQAARKAARAAQPSLPL